MAVKATETKSTAPEVATPVLTPELLAQIKEAVKAEVKDEVMAEMQAKIEENEKLATSDEIDPNTERKFVQQEKTLKQILKEGEQKTFEFPVDQLNPNEPIVVGLNGVFYSIPTGIEVTVPKPIFDIWKDSHTKTQAAMKKITISEVKEVVVQD